MMKKKKSVNPQSSQQVKLQKKRQRKKIIQISLIVIVVIVHLICYNWRKIHGGKSIIGFYFGLMLFFVSTVFLSLPSISGRKIMPMDGY